MSERVGGDPVRKGDDAVGEVMHGQPGDDLPQLHAGSSCAPVHHTHASIKDTRAPISSRYNYLVYIVGNHLELRLPNGIFFSVVDLDPDVLGLPDPDSLVLGTDPDHQEK